MSTVWINERFEDEAVAGVSVRDTGLLHAAGVFTTMRSYGGRVFRLEKHLARLRGSCGVLGIPMELGDEPLEGAVGELLKRNSLTDARLRLTVTRGKAGAEGMEPTVLLTATDLVPYPEEYYLKGMTAAVEDQQKLNPYDVQAGHKTLNYFSRLMALRTANQRGAGEAMLFDVHNYLQSGSVSNVFVVKGGVLMTPPTQEELLEKEAAERVPYPRSAVLPGVTRGAVLELAGRSGIKVQVSAIDIEGMLGADELFITNSIMGVMPVCRIERKAIGDDRPGEMTKRLMKAYAEWTIDGIGG